MKKLAPVPLALLVAFAVPALVLSATGDVIKAFPTPGKAPTALAYDGKALWIGDWIEGKLYKTDPESGKVLEEMASPGYHPTGLEYIDGCLFIADAGLSKIFKFDPGKKEIVTSYGTPGSSSSGLAADGKYLYLADKKDDKIYKLNPDDGAVIDYYKSPQDNVEGLACDGKYLWASDRITNEIYMLDPQDGTVFLIADSPGPYPSDLAFDGKDLWCADFEKHTLYRLIVGDDQKFKVTNKKSFAMTFRTVLRNTGTGVMKTADIYLAIPEDPLENQRLLKPLVYAPVSPKIEEDVWGQKVAAFHYENVPAGKEAFGEYRTEVEIGDLDYLIFPERAGTLSEIPKEILDKYTSDGSRYRIKEKLVAETAKQIVGDEKNAYRVGRKIFQWVISKLEYEMIGGWDVPEVLIKRGTGSCSEYAFLYIALCHVAGLPARFEASVAQRGDASSIDDVFHRWCEIYLPNYGWITVDPSAGDQVWPAEQARYFGKLKGKYFVTTHGAGDSKYLGWNYNYNTAYTYEGQGNVMEEAYGHWEPVTDAKEKAASGKDVLGCIK
jgi:transglutaminase-like putative cysteine protease/streptogramin lyase